MWLNDFEATSYILVLCVVVVIAVFALVVFGSIPCSCKYVLLLNYCSKQGRRRRSRGQVADSNRSSVIGSGSVEDPSSVGPRYPVYPFANAMSTSSGDSSASGGNSRQVTFVTLSPGQLPHYYEARVFKAPATIVDWGDEPPPTYESLFTPPIYSPRKS